MMPALHKPRGWDRMSPKLVLRTAQILTGVWAAAWVTFTIATLAVRPFSGTAWSSGAGFAAVLGALAAAAWWRPVWGGVLLVAAAALTALFFHNPCAYWGFATPAAALGVVLVLLGRAEAAETRPA